MKFNIALHQIILGVFFCQAGLAAAQETPPVDALTVDINAVAIVLNDEHRNGVDWEAIVADFHSLNLKQDEGNSSDKKYKLSVGTVSNEDYAVLLDALDAVGSMTQAKQPSALLKEDERQRVEINLGQNQQANIQLDLVYKNVGQGMVVSLEPILKGVLKGQTQLTVTDRATIVLGGIIAEQEITKTHKFPLLGSLPIVGFVFRSQGKLMQRIETIVFLTPHPKALPVVVQKQEAESS